jgi:hypothetical protein
MPHGADFARVNDGKTARRGREPSGCRSSTAGGGWADALPYHRLMAAALVLAACDDSTGPSRFSAQGTWAGQETNGPTRLSLSLTQKAIRCSAPAC